MNRCVPQLAAAPCDLVVIGAGIHGAWAAADAALRGLRVALIEQDDFGAGASANSQRIVHGGLRYLQHGDLARMRESIRERSILLRLAPALVRPLPVLVPTNGRLTKSRSALLAAMAAADLVGLDRNRGLGPEHRLPGGRLCSHDRCAEWLGPLAPPAMTGGALFHDAQILSSERLLVSILHTAAQAGAVLANHVRAAGLTTEGGRVTGVIARDLLDGREVRVRARAVLNCAGPGSGALFASLGLGERAPRVPVVKAAVIVTRRLAGERAVALSSPKHSHDRSELLAKGYRNLFITPWHEGSMVGTFYSDADGAAPGVSPEELDGYLREINEACPSLDLRRADVRQVYAGLLPRREGETDPNVAPLKRPLVIDHAASGGPAGLISAVGVKWTTARAVARRAVDAAAAQAGRVSRCVTARTPLDGGSLERRPADVERALAGIAPRLGAEVRRRLAAIYAGRAERIAALAAAEPRLASRLSPESPAIAAEIAHAAREEMACTLADAVLRRADLGTSGYPGDGLLRAAAEVMGAEFGWSDRRREQELAAVRARFEAWGCEHVY